VGNAGEAPKYVFLLFISVFYALGFHLKEEPILAKAEIVRNKKKEEKNRSVFFQLQRKCRERKIAWVLERPRFWFKHMVLNQYENKGEMLLLNGEDLLPVRFRCMISLFEIFRKKHKSRMPVTFPI